MIFSTDVSKIHVQLEMHLQQMQTEIENLVWERKELKKRLQVAIKDKKIMQVMLAELEDEHDEAILKIEQLEGQVDIFIPVFFVNWRARLIFYQVLTF